MKIALVNPPFLPRYSRAQRSPAVTRSGTLYYPIWLSHAGALLEEEGHQVKMIDGPAREMSAEEALSAVWSFEPRLVVVDTSTPSISSDLRFAGRIKGSLKECSVVAVGTHVSALPDESLAQCPDLDAVAVGEYELTLRDLSAALRDGGDMRNVPGLVFRDSGGGVVQSGPRPANENLDALPFVTPFYRRHLVPGHYFNPNALYPMVTLLTSRGCPFGCGFCLYPQVMMGRRLRLRSPVNVVRELQFVASNFPEVRGVFFEDDTFTINFERVESLCRAIIDSRVGLPWTANARADVPPELLELMRSAGCRQLCVGFESGTRASLEFMDKRLDVSQMIPFVEHARRVGILVHGCFMVGFPGETEADLERTFQLAKRLKPDTAQFYPVMVYPGTSAYEYYRKEGLLKSEEYDQWLDDEGLHNCVVSTGHVDGPRLVAFCNNARRRFYLRPAYVAYKAGQMIRNPHEAIRNLKALKTFARHLFRG